MQLVSLQLLKHAGIHPSVPRKRVCTDIWQYKLGKCGSHAQLTLLMAE